VTKPDPATVRVNAGLPAGTRFGLIEAIFGTGLVTVSVNVALWPPGAGLMTVMPSDPASATNVAGTVTVRLVLLAEAEAGVRIVFVVPLLTWI